MTLYQSTFHLIYQMLSKPVFKSNHQTDHLVIKFFQLLVFLTTWLELSKRSIYRKLKKNQPWTFSPPSDVQETSDRSLIDFLNRNINQLVSRDLNLWLLSQLRGLTVCWKLKEKWIKLPNLLTTLSQKNFKVSKSKREELWIIFQRSKRITLMMKLSTAQDSVSSKKRPPTKTHQNQWDNLKITKESS